MGLNTPDIGTAPRLRDELVTVAQGAQHAHIVDVTTTATGTELATAINGILAALEAFRINAAS